MPSFPSPIFWATGDYFQSSLAHFFLPTLADIRWQTWIEGYHFQLPRSSNPGLFSKQSLKCSSEHASFALCPSKASLSGFENTPLLLVLYLPPRLRSTTLLLLLAAYSSRHLLVLASWPWLLLCDFKPSNDFEAT